MTTAIACVQPAKAGIAPDLNFRAPLFADPLPAGRVLLLPDGKYLLYYNTQTLTDQRTGSITRYLPDGTLDTSFVFNRDNGFVYAAAAAADGKLYVSAVRIAYGSPEIEQILRLNADGSIDTSFKIATVGSEGFVAVTKIEVQPDGRVLVTGYFSTFSGAALNGIVRLLDDGTLDLSFAAVTIVGFQRRNWSRDHNQGWNGEQLRPRGPHRSLPIED